MKKIIVLLVLSVIVLMSCDLVTDLYIYSNLAGHDLYYADFGDIEYFDEASSWIRNNIEYREDSNPKIADPQTTVERGYGDCDEITLLFANIVKVELGIEVGFAAVLGEGERAIEDGGRVNHLTVYYNRKTYSAQGGYFTHYNNIGYVYGFNDAF